MRLTDMADELYAVPACSALPGGVRVATARHDGVTVTRVEIAREGLERPRGRYVTLEVPRVSVLDERDSGVIEQAAAELRALLPPEGPVLVLGVGNRRVTADAPGVSGATGLSLQQLAGALVRELRPSALLCVDSLCSSEPERLGRTLQFSDTGLCPAQPGSRKHLAAARLGVPVLAAGIPTLMEAREGKDLVVTPRELDSVIAHGAALLGSAINRALQPRLSIAQLCWLAS